MIRVFPQARKEKNSARNGSSSHRPMPKRCRQGSHVYTHITRYNETSPESHTVDSGYPNHSVIDSARARGALTSQHARRGRGCYMQGPMNRRDHASSWHPIALLLAEVTSGSSGATVVHGATAANAHGRQGTWVCEHSHTVSLSRSLAVVWSLTPLYCSEPMNDESDAGATHNLTST